MQETRVAQLEERIAALEMIVGQRPVDPEFLYTPPEVATWLRCGKTNVYDLMNRGDLASTRVGAGRAGLRVRGSSLIAFLDERTDGGPSPRGTFKYLAKHLDR